MHFIEKYYKRVKKGKKGKKVTGNHPSSSTHAAKNKLLIELKIESVERGTAHNIIFFWEGGFFIFVLFHNIITYMNWMLARIRSKKYLLNHSLFSISPLC